MWTSDLNDIFLALYFLSQKYMCTSDLNDIFLASHMVQWNRHSREQNWWYSSYIICTHSIFTLKENGINIETWWTTFCDLNDIFLALYFLSQKYMWTSDLNDIF
jgi:hypothetical protein